MGIQHLDFLFRYNPVLPALVPTWDVGQFCVLGHAASEWRVSNGNTWKMMLTALSLCAGNALISVGGSMVMAVSL